MKSKPKPTIDAVLADGAAVRNALAKGVHDALLQHKRAGNPVAASRNGRVVWIAPDDIDVPAPTRKTRRAG